MGIVRYLAELFEGHRLYPVEEIKLPEKPSIIVIHGAIYSDLKKIQEHWNENNSVPMGTILTGHKVTIEEIANAKSLRP